MQELQQQGDRGCGGRGAAAVAWPHGTMITVPELPGNRGRNDAWRFNRTNAEAAEGHHGRYSGHCW